MKATYKITTIFLILIFTGTSALSAPLPIDVSSSVETISRTNLAAMAMGLKFDAGQPVDVQMIIDPADSNASESDIKSQAQTFMEYFMAGLTMRQDQLWVNLSPLEPDRIIPEPLSQTQLGRGLLVQDYLLKQATAKWLDPQRPEGRGVWERVYQELYQEYGDTDLDISQVQKVWIVPDYAEIFETGTQALIVDARLKVMMEDDYLSAIHQREAEEENSGGDRGPGPSEARELLKNILVPVLEKEVNEGDEFVILRQMYHALILAFWYKSRLTGSDFSGQYFDQNHVKGLDTADTDLKETVYQSYLKLFAMGQTSVLQEAYDPAAQQVITRRFQTGGIVIKSGDGFLRLDHDPDRWFQAHGKQVEDRWVNVTGTVGGINAAMMSGPAPAIATEIPAQFAEQWLERLKLVGLGKKQVEEMSERIFESSDMSTDERSRIEHGADGTWKIILPKGFLPEVPESFYLNGERTHVARLLEVVFLIEQIEAGSLRDDAESKAQAVYKAFMTSETDAMNLIWDIRLEIIGKEVTGEGDLSRGFKDNIPYIKEFCIAATKRGFVLTNSQILDGYWMTRDQGDSEGSRGYAPELTTGGGKTLALALAAYLRKKPYRHSQVHIMTHSSYHAFKSLEDTGGILSDLGLSVGVVNYPNEKFLYDKSKGTLSKARIADILDADVVYADSLSFPTEYLSSEKGGGIYSWMNVIERTKKRFYLLIDELDTIKSLLATPDSMVNKIEQSKDGREELAKIVWQVINHIPNIENADQVREVLYFIPGAQEFMDRHKIFYDDLGKWIIDARRAREMREGVEYVVDRGQGKVVPYNDLTKRSKTIYAFSSRLDMLLHIKHGFPPSDQEDLVGIISYLDFFSRYNHVTGTSGTLRHVSEVLKNYLKLDVKVISSRTSQDPAEPERLFFDTQQESEDAMKTRLIEAVNAGRPVMLVAESVRDAKVYQEWVEQITKNSNYPVRLEMLLGDHETREELAVEARILSFAGQTQEEDGRRVIPVTVVTRTVERGTNISIDEWTREKGGVLLLIMNTSGSRHGDHQLAQRVGDRFGRLGEAVQFISRDSDVYQRFSPDQADPDEKQLNVIYEKSVETEDRELDWLIEIQQKITARVRSILQAKPVQESLKIPEEISGDVINRYPYFVHRLLTPSHDGRYLTPEQTAHLFYDTFQSLDLAPEQTDEIGLFLNDLYSLAYHHVTTPISRDESVDDISVKPQTSEQQPQKITGETNADGFLEGQGVEVNFFVNGEIVRSFQATFVRRQGEQVVLLLASGERAFSKDQVTITPIETPDAEKLQEPQESEVVEQIRNENPNWREDVLGKIESDSFWDDPAPQTEELTGDEIRSFVELKSLSLKNFGLTETQMRTLFLKGSRYVSRGAINVGEQVTNFVKSEPALYSRLPLYIHYLLVLKGLNRDSLSNVEGFHLFNRHFMRKVLRGEIDNQVLISHLIHQLRMYPSPYDLQRQLVILKVYLSIAKEQKQGSFLLMPSRAYSVTSIRNAFSSIGFLASQRAAVNQGSAFTYGELLALRELKGLMAEGSELLGEKWEILRKNGSKYISVNGEMLGEKIARFLTDAPSRYEGDALYLQYLLTVKGLSPSTVSQNVGGLEFVDAVYIQGLLNQRWPWDPDVREYVFERLNQYNGTPRLKNMELKDISRMYMLIDSSAEDRLNRSYETLKPLEEIKKKVAETLETTMIYDGKEMRALADLKGPGISHQTFGIPWWHLTAVYQKGAAYEYQGSPIGEQVLSVLESRDSVYHGITLYLRYLMVSKGLTVLTLRDHLKGCEFYAKPVLNKIIKGKITDRKIIGYLINRLREYIPEEFDAEMVKTYEKVYRFLSPQDDYIDQKYSEITPEELKEAFKDHGATSIYRKYARDFLGVEKGDNAMMSKGGIDFNPGFGKAVIRSAVSVSAFHLNPAVVVRPLILDVKPLTLKMLGFQ